MAKYTEPSGYFTAEMLKKLKQGETEKAKKAKSDAKKTAKK